MMPPDEALIDTRDQAALLERVGAGDVEALDRFYNDNVDGLYAFVFYRVGKDPELAQDVVQETFLAALERLGGYDPVRGSVLTWLCISSRNVIRRHLRVQHRAEELLAMWDRIDDSLARIYDSLASTPLSDEVVERSETRDLVNMTVAQLPERYRVVLERKYVSGESLRQLAATLELSEDAVKSLLARARKAFRATFTTLSQNVFGPEVDEEVRA